MRRRCDVRPHARKWHDCGRKLNGFRAQRLGQLPETRGWQLQVRPACGYGHRAVGGSVQSVDDFDVAGGQLRLARVIIIENRLRMALHVMEAHDWPFDFVQPSRHVIRQ